MLFFLLETYVGDILCKCATVSIRPRSPLANHRIRECLEYSMKWDPVLVILHRPFPTVTAHRHCTPSFTPRHRHCASSFNPRPRLFPTIPFVIGATAQHPAASLPCHIAQPVYAVRCLPSTTRRRALQPLYIAVHAAVVI